MRLTARVAASSVAAFVALLATSVPASAAPQRITGTLSKPGYSVIALAANGEGKATRATPRFSLRPPARVVTLHLRGPDGVYAGPIVVATSSKGKRALLGVKAGTKLGEIRVNSRKGYARLSSRLANELVDSRRSARAKKGVPLGAGNFGLVRSKVPRKSPPGDLDADGVANPLDIDANGNRQLDRYEQSTNVSAAARTTIRALVLAVNADGTVRIRNCGERVEATGSWPEGAPPPVVGKSYVAVVDYVDAEHVTVLSVRGPVEDGCSASTYVPRVGPALGLTLKDTMNANIPGVTVADLERNLRDRGIFWILAPAWPDVAIELDCGGDKQVPPRAEGLKYCTSGGTGRVNKSLLGDTFPLAFPDCCDSNPANGFGELRPLELAREDPGSACFRRCVHARLSHGASTDEVGTGDILNWRIREDDVLTEFPTALPDVFATVPAVTSYDDDGPGGNPPTRISYPIPQPYVGSDPPFNEPSEPPYHGFPVAPCANDVPPCVKGDVVLTFEFWPPQREAISTAGEEGQWTDIGRLVYAPGVSGPWKPSPQNPGGPSGPSLPNCHESDLFTTDRDLTPGRANVPFGSGAGYRDKVEDRRADPTNTLTFSVNVTQCLGRPTPGASGQPWKSGENVSMWLLGGLGESAAGENAAYQELLFTLE